MAYGLKASSCDPLNYHIDDQNWADGHKSHIGQKNVSHQNIEKNAPILF